MIDIVIPSKTFGDSSDIFDVDNSIWNRDSGLAIFHKAFNTRMYLIRKSINLNLI